MRAPQERGRDFEEEFAEIWGMQLVPQSGGGFKAKLDVGGTEVLVELKQTGNGSYRLAADDLRKAFAGAAGPGGKGKVMMFAVRMEGFDDLLIARVPDMLAILRKDVEFQAPTTKRMDKRAAAEPKLLRDEGER